MNNRELYRKVFNDIWLYEKTCKILDRYPTSKVMQEYKLEEFYEAEGLDTSQIVWPNYLKEWTE